MISSTKAIISHVFRRKVTFTLARARYGVQHLDQILVVSSTVSESQHPQGRELTPGLLHCRREQRLEPKRIRTARHNTPTDQNIALTNLFDTQTRFAKFIHRIRRKHLKFLRAPKIGTACKVPASSAVTRH